MTASPPAVDLLDPSFWPETGSSGFGAMRVLPGTGPKHEVVRILGGVEDPRVYRAVLPEFGEAVHALRDLAAEDRLGRGYAGGVKTVAAMAALQKLSAALEAVSEDTDAPLPPIRDYLEDPPRLMDDLARAIDRFVTARIREDVDRLCTFSLILFRDRDLNGAVTRSLEAERTEWRAALRPRDASAGDLHLALIPPPSAADAITRLAADLGCEALLPCVVFLGERPDPAQLSSAHAVRLSARRLEAPPPPIGEQLRAIYRSVYGQRAIAPGRPWAATADKFVDIAARHVNPAAVLRLLAGAVGGAGFVAAVDAALSVVSRA